MWMRVGLHSFFAMSGSTKTQCGHCGKWVPAAAATFDGNNQIRVCAIYQIVGKPKIKWCGWTWTEDMYSTLCLRHSNSHRNTFISTLMIIRMEWYISRLELYMYLSEFDFATRRRPMFKEKSSSNRECCEWSRCSALVHVYTMATEFYVLAFKENAICIRISVASTFCGNLHYDFIQWRCRFLFSLCIYPAFRRK